MENQPRRGESCAIVSVILGITSCVFVILTYLFWQKAAIYFYLSIPAFVLGVLGIIFAFVSVAKGNWSNLLISGIILSWVWVLSSVALLAITSGWLGKLLLKLHYH